MKPLRGGNGWCGESSSRCRGAQHPSCRVEGVENVLSERREEQADGVC